MLFDGALRGLIPISFGPVIQDFCWPPRNMADVEFELTYSFAATSICGKELLALERPVDGTVIAPQSHYRVESLIVQASMGPRRGFARQCWRKPGVY